MQTTTDKKVYTMNLEDHQVLIRSVVQKYCSNYRGHDTDIEDIVQDINERLLSPGSRHFNPDKGLKPSTWVYIVAKSVCLDHLRHTGCQPRHVDLDSLLNPTDDTEKRSLGKTKGKLSHDPTAAVLLLEHERMQMLEGILDKLPPGDREFIGLIMTGEMDLEQYAAKTNTTIKTLYVRKHRIIQFLKAQLASSLGCD